MPLPSSGPISIANINTELGRASTATSSLNETLLRSLAGRPSGTISLSDFYGKTRYGYVCGYCFEGQSVTISAPAGKTFTRLIFGRYGTPCPCPSNPSPTNLPTINCPSVGGVTDGAFCGNGVDFSGTNVSGATSLTFTADNGIYGDPCGGVYKQLTVIGEFG